MPLHSFDLGNVFVTCAWTVFLLCKVFVPQRSVGEAECERISVWLCGKLLLLPQCWLKPQSQVDTLSVNADSLGENDAVRAAVAATVHFFMRGEGCVSETCGLPPQPDAFASIQVMGKQTTKNELEDKVVVEDIYKLNEDGTVTITFKYEDGTEEVFDVLDPNSPGLLQEQSSQESFPWKIWKIKKIKEALERRRQHPSSSCPPGDFSFAFPNDRFLDPAQGLVTGCISGLSCNNESTVATSVRVLTNEAGFGLGEYVSPDKLVQENVFNVSASCEILPFSKISSIGSNSTLLLSLDSRPSFPCAGLKNSGPPPIGNCSDQVKIQYIS